MGVCPLVLKATKWKIGRRNTFRISTRLYEVYLKGETIPTFTLNNPHPDNNSLTSLELLE
jgi:hypothetical protein